MRKVLLAFLLIGTCLGAGAQKKAHWNADPVNHLDFYYNYSLGTPEGLSPSGWGFSLPISQIQYLSADERAMLTIDLVTLSVDFLYPQKGHLFEENGDIIPAPASYSKANSRIYTLGMTVPIGYTHKFVNGWGVGISIAPGIDGASYQNSYVEGDTRHDHNFHKNCGNIGFRLDATASVWYHGLGLNFRYKPFSYVNQGAKKAGGMLSAGIMLRY